MLGRPAPGAADEAGGMRIVHHDERAVALGQVADALQVGEVAVHAEHAVGRDQAAPAALGLGLLETALEVAHVGVLVAPALGLAQPHAVDDTGVV